MLSRSSPAAHSGPGTTRGTTPQLSGGRRGLRCVGFLPAIPRQPSPSAAGAQRDAAPRPGSLEVRERKHCSSAKGGAGMGGGRGARRAPANRPTSATRARTLVAAPAQKGCTLCTHAPPLCEGRAPPSGPPPTCLCAFARRAAPASRAGSALTTPLPPPQPEPAPPPSSSSTFSSGLSSVASGSLDRINVLASNLLMNVRGGGRG